MQILNRRDDGTFVILWHGHPYHVIQEDPLFAAVSAAAEGLDLKPDAPLLAPAFPAPPAALPSPLEWMDRIAPARQAVLLDALDATQEGRRFQKRMLAAREIDPKHPETQAGVAMLRAAGVLTEAEAKALLA